MTAADAWHAICGDATGRLYAVVSSAAADHHEGSSGARSSSCILVLDVSPDSLQQQQQGGSKDQAQQDASTPLRSLNVLQVVTTSPAIDFSVTSAAVSPNGHQLLLAGSARAEDTDVPVLALVDLYGSQPVSSSAAAAGSSSSISSSITAQYPSAKQRLSGLYYVHKSLYDERPGMRLLQAAWHPGSSSSHFAVLASDNRWRLYHTARLAEAEQTFWLRLPGTQQGGMGLHRGRSRGAPTPPRVTAFAFGPQNLGWAAFTVMFLASDGAVYALCPVAPFGLRARAAMLRQLPGVRDRGTVHTWLLSAFGVITSNESAASAAAAVSAQPHVLETLAPCLQGPLNRDAASLKPCTARRVACTMALSSGGSSGSEGLGGSGGEARFSALLTGFSSGTVYAHALELGQVLPCWQDATPQVAYDQRGEVAAVRYDVEAVAPKPPTAGLDTVPEESSSGAAPTTSAAAAANRSSSSTDLVPPLVLLDALKMNLHLAEPPARSTRSGGSGLSGSLLQAHNGGGGSSRRGRPLDSDEESDAGYDPSALPGHQQRQRGSGRGGGSRGDLNPAAAGGGRSSGSGGFGISAADDSDNSDGSGNGGGSDDDDSDDEADEQLQQLGKVTLLAAPELPGRYWACHDQGCWGINIKWLQQLNSGSGGDSRGAVGMFGSGSGSSDGGFGGAGGGAWGTDPLQQQQQSQNQQLPAPAVQELLVSGPGVSSCCVVGNALFGSGCVVLEKGLGPQLVFLKPRPTGVLGEGVVGGGGGVAVEGGSSAGAAAAAAAGAAGAAGAGDNDDGDDVGLGVSELLLTPEELDTRSRQQEYYADIIRGPPRLQQPPPRPDNLAAISPADPQGLQYSRDVTSWLSDSHVRYGVGVAVDLNKRLNELHELVCDQEVLLSHLKALAAEAAGRQAALQARIDRLAKASSALCERGNLLASMHWSLPRPASRAEQQMGRHMEVWEQQLVQTQQAWKVLRARLDGVIAAAEQQRKQTQQGAAAQEGEQQEQQPARSPAIGVRGLAASRAQARQVTQRPGGPLTPAQLERVRELLLLQHGAIAADTAELDSLAVELEAWRLEHPEVDLPARLAKLGTVV